MGRKSSEKKKRRTEEQHKVQKHEHKPQIKAVVPEIPPQPAKKLFIPYRRILSALISVTFLFVIVFVGANLFKKAFSAMPLSEILPYDKVIALIEINTNADHAQMVKAEKLLKNSAYSSINSIQKLNKRLGVDVEKDIKPWLGRNIGIAEMELPEGDLATVFFIETLSQKASDEFLKKIAEKNLSELKVTSGTEAQKDTVQSFALRYPGEDRGKDFLMYTAYLEDYAIFSPSDKAVRLVISKENKSSKKVANSDEYKKAQENLPINRIASIFMNFDKSEDKLFQKYGEILNSAFLNSAIKPFAALFSAESAVLTAGDNSFAVESFINLNSSYLKGNKYTSSKEKYSANLMDYVSQGAFIFWGGQNLEKQIKKIVAVLSEGEESTNRIFEEMLKNYSEKYFGSSVSMEDDIYPLVTDEFLLAVSKRDSKNVYTLLLKLDDPLEDGLKLQKIANNFISSGAVFEPHIEEHKLPDGTVSKELVATPEELIKSESTYKDIAIYEMETESKNWGIYYAIFDSSAIISTSKKALTEDLDVALNSSQNSLKKSNIFTWQISPLMSYSDEVSYFDLSQILQKVSFIKSLSTSRQYVNDGIMSNYHIYVE